jgi:hypothetical protein
MSSPATRNRLRNNMFRRVSAGRTDAWWALRGLVVGVGCLRGPACGKRHHEVTDHDVTERLSEVAHRGWKHWPAMHLSDEGPLAELSRRDAHQVDRPVLQHADL